MRCQGALFSAYRTDQYADPDGFMASLGLVFSQYPDDVIEYVCDPRTGVQRGQKFPPTISEIVEACDARISDMKRRERYQNWGKNEAPLLEGPREERPTYDQLKAKYGPDWGITVAEQKRGPPVPAPTIDQLRHHYQHYDLAFRPKEKGASHDAE